MYMLLASIYIQYIYYIYEWVPGFRRISSLFTIVGHKSRLSGHNTDKYFHTQSSTDCQKGI